MNRAPLTRLAIALLKLAALLAIVFVLIQCRNLLPGLPMIPANAQIADQQAIEQAILQAIEKEKESLPAFTLYETRIDDITISQDGNWATAWLTPIDPDTGNVVPTEPGMVIVQRVEDGWKVYLPNDPDWSQALMSAPEDLVSTEKKSAYAAIAELAPSAAPAAPITGYYLPWRGGDTMRLTQSVGHDRYTPSGSAHFAFDFASPGYPSGMFNVYAAKGGSVARARWTQENGDPNSPGNYLVLEDRSTSPVTYQLYLHLAKDSIPAQFRVAGAQVRRGQIIGIADDTGVSSGNHLHFMVHTNPSSYWGTSVDITFADVSINGGRPRIQSDLSYCHSGDVCNSTQVSYVSNNFMSPDSIPPVGGILEPKTGDIILSPVLHINGWALDENSGLASVKVIGSTGQGWSDISNSYSTNSFSFDWDMCAGQVPDGPISLALEIRDRASNQTPGLPGLTHFSKNFACTPPPPACVPGASQIALFDQKDYRGECVVLGTGNYQGPSSLGTLGDNSIVSIQVGANVQATLYQDASLQGRAETFLSNDSNLSDNRIGKKTVSSVRVQSRGTTPSVPIPVWPDANAAFPSDTSISLSWTDAGGAVEFKARVLLNGIEFNASPWGTQIAWQPGNLPPGSYTWQVRGRSGSLESSWSTARTLTIQNTTTLPTSPNVMLPFTDTMESNGSGWTNGGGWIVTNSSNHTPGGSMSWKYAPAANSYDTGSANAGFITSLPIPLPAGETHYLRFWYLYSTESPEKHYDQRRVQISVNGGTFTDLLQLSGDPTDYWLRSPAISLAAYAGQTIRLRFYFATLDRALNGFSGWNVDDVSVSTEAPPACSDADNDPSQATLIQYGGSSDGVICPGGDVDYYRFQGTAGDQVGIWTEAQVIGSPLDTFINLLDSDGRSVLESNDDQVQYQRSDSWLSYTLPRSGDYFIQVQAWDNPTSGGEDYRYSVKIVRDQDDPIGIIQEPGPDGVVRLAPTNLTVFASDGQSGISYVRFYWHSSDWRNSGWTALGKDWDGSDGWNLMIDTSTLPNLYGGAFYVQIFDKAGNWFGAGVWNLKQLSLYLPFVTKPR
jgi:murein DD-endopeptidase MepM/ murein hydrolase activator NlpD